MTRVAEILEVMAAAVLPLAKMGDGADIFNNMADFIQGLELSEDDRQAVQAKGHELMAIFQTRAVEFQTLAAALNRLAGLVWAMLPAQKV